MSGHLGDPIKTYRTQGHHEDCFTVKIYGGNNVEVLNNTGAVYTARCAEVYVGSCPPYLLGEDEGYYEMEGNTILLKPDADKNVYHIVACTIESFTTEFPIVKFMSPMADSAPHPYAVDSQGYHYLFVDEVRIRDCAEGEDPFVHYLSRFDLTPGETPGEPTTPVKVHGKTIKKLYSGGGKTMMYYTPFPQEYYDMYMSGKHNTLHFDDGSEEALSKEAYVDIMEKYGEEQGLSPFSTETIVGHGFFE